MNGESNVASQQRLVYLLREETLAAKVSQRLVLDAISTRGDDAQGCGILIEAMMRDQAMPHMLSLPQRKGAATRANGKICRQSAKTLRNNNALCERLAGS